MSRKPGQPGSADGATSRGNVAHQTGAQRNADEEKRQIASEGWTKNGQLAPTKCGDTFKAEQARGHEEQDDVHHDGLDDRARSSGTRDANDGSDELSKAMRRGSRFTRKAMMRSERVSTWTTATAISGILANRIMMA